MSHLPNWRFDGLFCLVAALGIPDVRAEDPQKPTGPRKESAQPRLVVQLGHTNSAIAVAFSPDGRLALTAGHDRVAILWEVNSGREIHRFTGHLGSVYAVAFSPDGQTALTGSADATARLWDIASGRKIRELKGHGFSVLTVAFAQGGKLAATGGWDGRVIFWDLMTGKEVGRLSPAQPFKDVSPVIVRVAFAPDGNSLLTCSSAAVQLWDVSTGEELVKKAGGHAIFSPDGKIVFQAECSRPIRAWETATGKELRQFDGTVNNTPGMFRPFAVSPDGRSLLCPDRTGALATWLTAAGRQVRRWNLPRDRLTAVAISPDGRSVLASDRDGRIWFGDLATATFRRRFDAAAFPVASLAFSPDGQSLATGGGKAGRLWSLRTGSEFSRLSGHTNEVLSVAFSPDSRTVATGSWDKTARLWDATTGMEIQQFPYPATETLAGVLAVTFAPNQHYLLVGGTEGARLWELATGKEVQHIEPKHDVDSAAFFPDGKSLMIGGSRYETATGKRLHQFSGHQHFSGHAVAGDWVAIAPGSASVVTASTRDPRILLWDVQTGRIVRHFQHGSLGDECVLSVAISPDGRFMLSGGADHEARVWDVKTGRQLRALLGHIQPVNAVAFSPDGRRVATGGNDTSTRLWEVESGKELCRLFSFVEGGWAVVSPEGRFDTHDLDAIEGLHWVAPDEPYRPLPPEIFMRDYYEPRLLARVLAGEKFKPIRSLGELNRVQPSVLVQKVEAQPDRPDEVTVTVEVAEQSGTFTRDGKQVTLDSGVFDVHLFRDGQLVGRHPSEDGSVRLDVKTGRATITFPHICLPRKDGLEEVEFSAYAFNVDRVKSQTHLVKYKLPGELSPRMGTAYLVCVGVNAFDSPAWDLRFAVSDARAIAECLGRSLKGSGQFDRVVVVPLVSDSVNKKGKRTFTENTATRANVRAVLSLLAGEPVDPATFNRIPAASQLQRARPEDLVLLSFSTHGFNGNDGQFYLLPSDIGSGHDRVTERLMGNAISTDDLSLWLRGVDAGEMVMVVDACHSAGSVEQDGFKPGPMGSRGLGQLAYNKRMRILAASQASDVAFEHARIGHGLLTYALCTDGLNEGRADFAPVDRKIALGELLQFGVMRVPQLAEEIATGKMRAVSLTGRDLQVKGAEKGMIFRQGRRSIAQQPALFDFTRGSDGILLQELAQPNRERE